MKTAVETGKEGEDLGEGRGLIDEGDGEFGHDERTERGELVSHRRCELDGVLFGCQEAVGTVAAGRPEDAGDGGGCVAVVVRQGEVVDGSGEAGGGEHGGEIEGAGDAGKEQRPGGKGTRGEVKAAAEEQGGAAIAVCGESVDEAIEGGGFFFAEEKEVGAAEGREGLAEVAGGKEGIGGVLGGEEDEVEIAVEAPMLEAVIEDVDDG